MEAVVCRQCRREFVPKKSARQFCSLVCYHGFQTDAGRERRGERSARRYRVRAEWYGPLASEAGLSVSEAAFRAGVSTGTVRRWRAEGRLPKEFRGKDFMACLAGLGRALVVRPVPAVFEEVRRAVPPARERTCPQCEGVFRIAPGRKSRTYCSTDCMVAATLAQREAIRAAKRAAAGVIGMGEAARRAGCSRTTLHTAIQAGRLAATVQGVRPQDLAAWMVALRDVRSK